MKDRKNLGDAVKFFTEEDIAEIAKVIEDIDQKEREFFSSERCQVIISQIKKELQTKPVIHDDPYSEFLFGDVTDLEFSWLFSCLFNESISGLDSKNFGQEDDNYNEEFRVFDGMLFRMISGQGIGLDVRMDKSSSSI